MQKSIRLKVYLERMCPMVLKASKIPGLALRPLTSDNNREIGYGKQKRQKSVF